jgi:DNA-binding transcriptional LysR family regulator
MDIKHLKYFVVAAEHKSLSKAAICLFTTQPNVSKTIGQLEKELGYEVFDRTTKGIQLTPLGLQLFDYATTVLRNVELMKGLGESHTRKRIKIASYASNMISRALTDFYKKNCKGQIDIDYYEGSVEEITDYVSNLSAEIGILYVAKRQMKSFEHIIHHKNLEFVPITTKDVCIYVGENNPLFHVESVQLEDLKHYHFVQGSKDFFSMEHHFEHINVGVPGTENLKNSIRTNSDHMSLDMLLYTDVCYLGIDLMHGNYHQYPIRALPISDCDQKLILGYVIGSGAKLSAEASQFLTYFTEVILT